jgi:OmpA-OmpF porin, OOP family
MLNRKLAPFLLLMVLSACASERAAEPRPDAASNLVFFDRDQVSLSDKSMVTIKRFAEYSKRVLEARIDKDRLGTRIDVVGFADGSGSEIYNMALSLRRANAVKIALVNEGVPVSAIVVIAKGATQPLVATPDGVREWQNRRVELVLH